jgi:hypothetical protein
MKLSPKSSAVATRSQLITHCSLLIAVICLTACSTNETPRATLTRIATFPARVLDKTAELVTVTTTNIVEQAIITSTDVVTQDPATLLLITNTTLQTNFTLVTNITAEIKPAITKTVTTAETVTGFVPPPWGEAAGVIFAGISGFLTWAVRRRNAMLKSVVDGVERAGLPAVKEEISAASMRDGTAPEIHEFVKKITRS